LIYCCRACRFNRSGFSVRENKITRAVDRVIFELKFWLINWLNNLNGISGKGASSDDAEVMGSMAKAIIQRRIGKLTAMNAKDITMDNHVSDKILALKKHHIMICPIC
jgi:hypothetical protein